MLLALLGTTDEGDVWIDGTTLTRRLAEVGRDQSASRLLVQLLSLEDSGHVRVDRDGGYRFALTATGQAAAWDLGPGTPGECVLVMADLVGFVTFTASHGDEAAHGVARRLHEVADDELTRRGGRLVKHLGDGVLGTIEKVGDAAGLIGAIGRRCPTPEGSPWPMRGAVHAGRPIQHRGDVFGADVNLVARLCALAEPGELVISAPDDPAAAPVVVRGLDVPVPIVREAVG